MTSQGAAPVLVSRRTCSLTLRNVSYRAKFFQSCGVTRQRVSLSFLERDEPLLLRLLGEVEPELHEDRAVVDEHLLERPDPIEIGGELAVGHPIHHPADNRVGVPAAEEHADLPLRWERPPEAPHLGAEALGLGGGAERAGSHVARIEPFIEQVHRLALARAVDAVDEHDDREGLVGEELVLCLEGGRPSASPLPSRTWHPRSCVPARRTRTSWQLIPRGRALSERTTLRHARDPRAASGRALAARALRPRNLRVARGRGRACAHVRDVTIDSKNKVSESNESNNFGRHGCGAYRCYPAAS